MKILSPPDTIALLVPNRAAPNVTEELAHFGEWVRSWWWIAEMRLHVLEEMQRLRERRTPISVDSLEVFARAKVQQRFAASVRREMGAEAKPS